MKTIEPQSSVRPDRRRVLAGLSVSGLPLMPAGRALAQAWPTRPIRVIVGFPPGGLTDVFARSYGEHLSQRLGQPVVVENRTGAGGTLAAVALKNSAPDGYTLMFTISSTLIMNRLLYKNLPYDSDRDFTLLSHMSGGHLPFIVNKDLGVTNLKEFVEYARRNKVSLGSYSPGSYSHIVIAELNRIFGLKIEAVHYRGEAPMWQDVAAGVIAGGNGSLIAAGGIVQSGAARPIAVPLNRRMKLLPDVPTFHEQGVTDRSFKLCGFACALGPAGMSADLVQRLSDLFVEAGKTERTQKILATFGIDEAAVGHQEFRKIYEEDAPLWLALVKSLGLTPQ